MLGYLVVADAPGVDGKVLDWVAFRIIEGSEAFRVVVVGDAKDGQERLAGLISGITGLGGQASGETTEEKPSRILRRYLGRVDVFGVILAAHPGRFASLRRLVRRLEKRHGKGIVWVRETQPSPLVAWAGHDRHRGLASADSDATGVSLTDRRYDDGESGTVVEGAEPFPVEGCKAGCRGGR